MAFDTSCILNNKCSQAVFQPNENTATTVSENNNNPVPVGQNDVKEKVNLKYKDLIIELSGKKNISENDILNSLYEKIDNLDENQQEAGVNNILSGVADKIKSFFGLNKNSNVSNVNKAEDVNNGNNKFDAETIRMSIEYLSANLNGIDDEDESFKALPEEVKKCIVSYANNLKNEQNAIDSAYATSN